MLPDPDQDEPIDWAAFAEAQPIGFARACDQARQDALAANEAADAECERILNELA